LERDLPEKTKLELLQFHCAPIHAANLTFLSSAQTTLRNHYPYIDRAHLNHGLLELRIETTSEVVSILIGWAAHPIRSLTEQSS